MVRMLKEKIGSETESWVCDFVDWRLDGEFSHRQVVTITVSCLEEERNKRPSDADALR